MHSVTGRVGHGMFDAAIKSINSIAAFNSYIKHAMADSSRRLLHRPLNLDTLQMRTYADASFASNDDHSSQVGILITLCENRDQYHIIDYSDKKYRRVVHSIMRRELCAFTKVF